MLIAFPAMHEGLAAGLPQAVRLFDPGLEAAPAARGFRPEGLPLDPRQARRTLAEMLQLGEQFAHVSDLSSLRAQTDFYTGTSLAIRSELEDRLRGDDQARLDKARVTAQTELLLAYTFEERQQELSELESGVAAASARFQSALGLDADAAELAELGLSAAPEPAVAAELPWRPVLAAMLAFLPEDAVLVTDAHGVAEDLVEAGLAPLPAAPEDLAAWGLSPADGPAASVMAPGRALCGLGRADPGRPWLAAPRRIVCLTRGRP